jgi:hypothetical protein
MDSQTRNCLSPDKYRAVGLDGQLTRNVRVQMRCCQISRHNRETTREVQSRLVRRQTDPGFLSGPVVSSRVRAKSQATGAIV